MIVRTKKNGNRLKIGQWGKLDVIPILYILKNNVMTIGIVDIEACRLIMMQTIITNILWR